MEFAFKRKSSDPKEQYFTKLKDIHITTVDSYQASIHVIDIDTLFPENLLLTFCVGLAHSF